MLLGFVDLNIVLSTEEEAPLREKILRLMMEALPTEDTMLEKIFTDNIRQIKKKWYKDQHRRIKFELIKAQEKGDQELLNRLVQEKEKLLIEERELN